jgi:hypothetical protein
MFSSAAGSSFSAAVSVPLPTGTAAVSFSTSSAKIFFYRTSVLTNYLLLILTAIKFL